MKVAIDISPISSTHKVRGIGSYTKNLIDQYKKKDWGIDFQFFEKGVKPSADVIHYPYFDIFFHTLPLFHKTKTVVTIHDLIPLVFPEHFPRGVKGSFNLFLQKKSLSHVDQIISDSKASKIDIQRFMNIPEERIHPVFLGVSENFKPVTDSSQLENVSKKYKLPKEFVLFVGDLNWNKNLNNLLQAVKLSNKPLVLVGKAFTDNNLNEANEIRRLINELNLNRLVTFTGYVDEPELVLIYNLAKMTLLPSFYEGFGLSVVESMACQTPIVCSANSSLLEITSDCAIYCNPREPNDICAKIKYVWNLNDLKLKELKKKLKKNAARFSWKTTAEKTIQVYKRAASA